MAIIESIRVFAETIEPIQSFFNKFLVAFIIFLLGLIISRIVGKFVTKILHEVELRKIVKKATKIDKPVDERAGKIVFYALSTIVAFIALDYAGLRSPVLYIIGGILLFVVAGALLLAIKDFIPNFMGTLAIYRKNIFKVGDIIEVAGVTGKVKEIGFINTILIHEKDKIYIPNATIIKNKLTVKKL